jgi:hypothetical protein
VTVTDNIAGIKATGVLTRIDQFLAEARDFSPPNKIISGAHPLGHELNKSPPFSAEVKNAWQLPLLPCMPSWYAKKQLPVCC